MLWRKVRAGLSAGRVQSVATRLVVERERERMAFRSASYWDVEGTFARRGHAVRRPAGRRGRRPRRHRPRLRQRRASSRTRGRRAPRRGDRDARWSAALEGAPFAVRSVEDKPYSRKPAAPFITSTLQQEASRKLRCRRETTMRVAQRLYENGYITYMRTDSTTLSESALDAARSQARELYGPEYVPDVPRRYEQQGQERAGGARGRTPGR